jgi:hypothetical protein
MRLRVTKITGSRSVDWIYWHFGYKLSLSHSIITLLLIHTLSSPSLQTH